MLEVERGRFWAGVFVREWWHWFGAKNWSGLHGYRFWWKVGPFQMRWGRHAKHCVHCHQVLRNLPW